MAVTYTSVARVQAKAHNMSTNVSTGDIEIFINDAESLIDTIMKTSFLENFSATKHGILQAAATAIAALSAVTADPSTFSDLAEAQSIMDVLWAEAFRYIFYLSDSRIVEALQKK